MKRPVIDSTEDRITPAAVAGSATKLVEAGAVLCVMRFGILRHTFPVAIAAVDVTLNQDMRALTPGDGIHAPYLAHYLRSSGEAVLRTTSKQGTTVNSIEGEQLDRHPVPVPPLDVQRRIVAGIDALFADLEEGEALLARARDDLETWRKALLKAAVTGELTTDWRAANPPAETGADLLARTLDQRRARWIAEPRNNGKRYTAPPAPDISRLAPVPDGWTWTTVDVAGAVLLGRKREPERHAGEHMRPYLRVANVLEGRLDLRDVKEMNFTPSDFETFALQRGDVLLNEGQSPEFLGRPAIYQGEIQGCCFQNTLFRFRPTPAVLPEFALTVFRQYMHGKRFLRESRITTNIGHLTQVRFLPMEFPLPPLDEQREMARRVGEAEAAWDDTALSADLSGPLRQSILSAAFRGDLSA